jgi:hypothetical protein
VDWDAFDPTWQYNPGRDALAPNFGKFERLKTYPTSKDEKPVLNQVMARYQQDMNGTRMTQGEFTTLLRRMDKQEIKIQDINYQVGSLAEPQYQALMNAGVMDSKIMAIPRQLGHGSGGKNAGQKVPVELYTELYQTIQEPEAIYENTAPNNPRHGREFHFSKKVKNQNGKILNIVLRKIADFALQIITMGLVGDDHANKNYKKIW